MRKIIFYTRAYNAEKTMRRAIESVLNQTYTNSNLVYYILDNGSTDKTGEIIAEYAKIDHHIVMLRNDINNVPKDGNRIMDFLKQYSNDSYFIKLDADDEYKPDFLEKMLMFMQDNKLDVAACGNNFVDAINGQTVGIRKLEHNLILESKNDFNLYFPVYHQFMRTMWGKIYLLSAIRAPSYNNYKGVSYGFDTIFSMKSFYNASRAGILAESLHKYYLFPKSESYRFDKHRIESDRILFDATNDFLVSKCGYVSKQNEKFLSDVYFCSLKDTFNVIVGSQVEPIETMRNILDMFTNETTVGQLENGYGSGDIFKSLRSTILKWLLSQKICRRSEGAKLAAEILSALYKELLQLVSLNGLCYYVQKMPEVITFLVEKDYVKALERIQIYYKRHDKDEPALAELEIALYKILNKTNSELFSLLSDIKINRHKCSETLNVDAEISTIIGKYPLLNSLNIDLAVLFSRPVQHIMEGDYGKALDSFLSVTGVEINDDDAEKYIMFGQNLSAAAQNSNTYIYFKKVWISYLIDHSKNEAAAKELDEFLKILPHDNDFLKLKQRLGET